MTSGLLCNYIDSLGFSMQTTSYLDTSASLENLKTNNRKGTKKPNMMNPYHHMVSLLFTSWAGAF